jgi:hypothetical protein
VVYAQVLAVKPAAAAPEAEELEAPAADGVCYDLMYENEELEYAVPEGRVLGPVPLQTQGAAAPAAKVLQLHPSPYTPFRPPWPGTAPPPHLIEEGRPGAERLLAARRAAAAATAAAAASPDAAAAASSAAQDVLGVSSSHIPDEGAAGPATNSSGSSSNSSSGGQGHIVPISGHWTPYELRVLRAGWRRWHGYRRPLGAALPRRTEADIIAGLKNMGVLERRLSDDSAAVAETHNTAARSGGAPVLRDPAYQPPPWVVGSGWLLILSSPYYYVGSTLSVDIVIPMFSLSTLILQWPVAIADPLLYGDPQAKAAVDK